VSPLWIRWRIWHKIFSDDADLARMRSMYAKPYIKGLTTNPTLMRNAGVPTYRAFAEQALGDARQANLFRGVGRRFYGNGAPSARNRRLGAECLRQNPRDQHAGALKREIDQAIGAANSKGWCHCRFLSAASPIWAPIQPQSCRRLCRFFGRIQQR
jgi:hypothetical protein